MINTRAAIVTLLGAGYLFGEYYSKTNNGVSLFESVDDFSRTIGLYDYLSYGEREGCRSGLAWGAVIATLAGLAALVSGNNNSSNKSSESSQDKKTETPSK